MWPLPRRERWQPPWPAWTWAAPLLLLTLATTTVVGARLAFNFARHLPPYATANDLWPFPWAWHHPQALWAGLGFSLPLLAILLAHELGHFLACRYYRMDSTLPLFLPAPTLIGTLGAFIRIRSPFADRREVFDVGIAGPLAGMVVTVPLLIYGLAGSRVLQPGEMAAWSQQFVVFGWPLGAQWVAAWLHPGVAQNAIALSPLARAAWIGLLLTMLNLVPGAQLDGGHILYAVAPRLHTVVSWGCMAALAVGGYFYWPGWYVFAAFIALMRVRHPAVAPGPPLGRARAVLALVAVGVMVVAFTAAPLLAG